VKDREKEITAMADEKKDQDESPSGSSDSKKGRYGKPTGGSTDRKRKQFPRQDRQDAYSKEQSRSSSTTPTTKGDAKFGSKSGFEYSGDVLQFVTPLLVQQPAATYQKYVCAMTPSYLFDSLAEAVYRTVLMRSVRPEPLVTLEDIRLCFRYVLAMRIGQVQAIQLPQRPAEVRYPALLGPVLASVGKFIHPTAAYEISPTFDVTDNGWLTVLVIGTDKKDQRYVERIVKPPTVDATLGMLLNLGMPMNISLPVEVLVDTDEIYRLDDAASQLTGSGDFAVSSGLILSRALLHYASLAGIYGMHRVVYANLDSLRTAVDKLARDSFTMQAGTNTM